MSQARSTWLPRSNLVPACVALLAAMIANGSVALADMPLKGEPLKVVPAFAPTLTKKGKLKPISDLSGVACEPPEANGERRCLFVSDESLEAQWARVTTESVEPEQTVTLNAVAKSAAPKPPRGGCTPSADARELDVEAIARLGKTFYLLGSHGCSRGKHGDSEWRTTQFQVFRFTPEETPALSSSHRLSEALVAAPLDEISKAFGRQLDAASNGLTIEGLAVDSGHATIGLRAPAGVGVAYLIEVDRGALFDASRPLKPEVIALQLPGASERVGVRDLAWLGPEDLLVLTGPAQEAAAPYRIYRVVLGRSCRLGLVAELAPVTGEDGLTAKAEGLVVLGSSSDAANLLVTYDSAPQGAPHSYTMPLGPDALKEGLCQRYAGPSH